MRMLLRKLGYDCVVANHGAHALELLEEHRKLGPEHEIEVILMDQAMDVMDGMECTRIIRATQSDKHVRPFIIAQTANATSDTKPRLSEAHAAHSSAVGPLNPCCCLCALVCVSSDDFSSRCMSGGFDRFITKSAHSAVHNLALASRSLH